jgi:uncharacterized membrane protein
MNILLQLLIAVGIISLPLIFIMYIERHDIEAKQGAKQSTDNKKV